MVFETLYKRTKTGAIQYWQISVDETTPFPVIVKESGQLGTSFPTFHKEVISVGKQKRTFWQQAEAEALSDWKRKHDEGYKTLKEIDGIPGDKYEGTEPLHSYLDRLLPKFNTDASGNVKPMLATDYTKIKKIKFPAYCQPKLDGVRCLLIADIQEGIPSITFLSRSGKPYTSLGHIEIDVLDAVGLGRYILDGEIYSDELTFQEIVSAVKATKPSSLKLKFRVYDVVNPLAQANRLVVCADLVERLNSKHITIVDTKTVTSIEEVKQLHDKWVSEGYEGAMIRHLDGLYGQGQRSRDLLKVKEFDETEFAFKNFEFGQRGVEDLIAVCWTHDGTKEFRAKMIGTKAQKEELYSNDGLEGMSLTVKHFGWTEDELPRFPIGKAFRNGY